MINLKILIILLITAYQVVITKCCTSFYCINSCGVSNTNKGYKLILANNRDENIYRLTTKASLWPSANDISVYGALDLQNGQPPEYYSTWLGINNKGNVGNLLFFMKNNPSKRNKLKSTKPRGIIVSNYLLNSKSIGPEYLESLGNEKNLYGPFNYVQLVMSELNGDYSLYYINNNDTNKYKQMNPDSTSQFIFGISNSDPDNEFQKVTNGKMIFKDIIQNYGLNANKSELVQSLLDLLQNTTSNMPDPILTSFMNVKNENVVEGVSRINANYTTFWANATTRTSSLILVDFDNNVEYYEYNMSSIDFKWNMNKLNEFKIKNVSNKQIKPPPSMLLLMLFLAARLFS